nr:MAG TPA: hypothetical protein [Caudoviricetes sp.]
MLHMYEILKTLDKPVMSKLMILKLGGIVLW